MNGNVPILWAKMDDNQEGILVLSLVFSYQGKYIHVEYGYDGEKLHFFAPVEARSVYPKTIPAKEQDMEKYQTFLCKQFPEDVEKASQFLQFSWNEKR